MAHIKTTYKPDGSVLREPQGYGGGLCDQATAPYEKNQAGRMEKRATPEADEPPALEAPAEESQTQELGG